MKIDLSKTQKYLNWLSTKLFLDNIAEKSKTRIINRGMVYWCHFGYNIGSELSKSNPRPCVIIQKEEYNKKSPNVIVVPVTHSFANLSCIVPLETRKNESGDLILDGYVNVSNIMCISKARLTDPICELSSDEVKKIEFAIMRQLDIMKYYKDLEDKFQKSKKYIVKANDELYKQKQILNEVKGVLRLEDNEIKHNLKNILDKLEK
ncbi:type II toxin-antitoxin system PemK/MazF family toxin [Clostridium sp. HBUAS56010]|uniref:type II toxin-antitoxin system PemK/MazF family toxin n=1 Tax=Clostridium sp. HBUAS56010 TaxID=2571127 RepID=UPI001178B6E8|nr:type II toxin-antitoxin system PemK/MazF family toxin [Clostridium sp. HBUAS56010]